MMKRKHAYGFSMLETMIGTIAGAIVLLGASAVLMGSHKSWSQSWSRAHLQRDAALAMRSMSYQLRAGSHVQVDSDGHGIDVNTPSGSIRYFWTIDSKDLNFQRPSGAVQPLISGSVSSVSFLYQNSLVTIDLRLSQDAIHTSLVSSVMPRNTGG